MMGVLLACSLHACSTFFAPLLLSPPPRAPAPVNHFQHSHVFGLRAALGAEFEPGTALRQAANTAASESESTDEDDAALEADAQAFFQAPGLSIRDIASMTVPQLKDELRERGLKVGGNKGELLERLSAALEGRGAAPGAVATSKSRPPPAPARAASSGRKAAVVSTSKAPAGGGIMLAEGERLPQAPPMPKRTMESTPTARIFVRGLPFRSPARDVAIILEEAFGPVAKLEGMTLDGRATGHAWVTFENPQIARDAVEEGRIEMDNRPIYFSPPWSLASREALREMADFAAQQAELRGDAPPQPLVSLRAPLARSGRDVSTDYVPVATQMEEEEEGSASEEPGGRTLFVGRVPLDAEEDDIRDALSAMGEVDRIFMGRVSKNNPDSDFAGYAHVQMKDLAAVTKAISSPVTIKGQRVRVDRAVDGAKETREERFPLELQYHGSLIGVAGTVSKETYCSVKRDLL
jgi:RNA recognition motif-containing protein